MVCNIYSLLTHFFSIIICINLTFWIALLDICTLYFIYKDAIYGLYFAFFFLIIGIFIISKSYRNYVTKLQNVDFIQVEKLDKFDFYYMITLGCILLISGIFSILVHTHFFISLNYKIRVPFLSLISIGVIFALIIPCIDISNIIYFCIYKSQSKKYIIYNKKQIIPLMTLGMILGLIVGIFFSVLNLEDLRIHKFSGQLMDIQNILLPIIIFIGTSAGLIITIFFDNNDGLYENKDGEFKPLKQEEEV